VLDANVNAVPASETVSDIYPVADTGSLVVTYHDQIDDRVRDTNVKLMLPSQLLLGNQVVSDARVQLVGKDLSLALSTAKGVTYSTPAVTLPPTVWSNVEQRFWLAKDEELKATRDMAAAGAAALALASAHAIADIGMFLLDKYGVQIPPIDLPDLPDSIVVNWDMIKGKPLKWEPGPERLTLAYSQKNFIPGDVYLRNPLYALPDNKWSYGMDGLNSINTPSGWPGPSDSRLMVDPQGDRLGAKAIDLREEGNVNNLRHIYATPNVTVHNDLVVTGGLMCTGAVMAPSRLGTGNLLVRDNALICNAISAQAANATSNAVVNILSDVTVTGGLLVPYRLGTGDLYVRDTAQICNDISVQAAHTPEEWAVPYPSALSLNAQTISMICNALSIKANVFLTANANASGWLTSNDYARFDLVTDNVSGITLTTANGATYVHLRRCSRTGRRCSPTCPTTS
jgi:hypothetical protein